MDYLASLTLSKTVYVVWAQTASAPPENLGELEVENNLKGELKTITPQRNFELLVTAENDPRATAPTGPVMATIHQSQ